MFDNEIAYDRDRRWQGRRRKRPGSYISVSVIPTNNEHTPAAGLKRQSRSM